MTLIVDTDTHITEPTDLWTSRMSSKKWGDSIPQVRWNQSTGEDWWYVSDKPVFRAGTSIVTKGDDGSPTRSPDFPSWPKQFGDLHPSSYEAKARVEVMDDYGITAAALYPNLGFVAADIYSAVGPDNLAFQAEAVRAYNDFIIDFSNEAPGRFIPLACIPFWDVNEAVAEIQRAAGLGHKGLVSTGKPQEHGQQFLADHYWDPMWAAAQDAGMSISFHAGGGNVSRHWSKEQTEIEGELTALTRVTTTFFIENAITVTDLLTSGVLARFPELKFYSVESGIGWIPFLLEALDEHFVKYQPWRERPEFGNGEMLPSEYFRRQVYSNFWFETLEPWHIEKIGADNILFGTDFPHPTFLDGADISDVISDGIAGVSEEVQEKVLWKNAAHLFKLDLA